MKNTIRRTSRHNEMRDLAAELHERQARGSSGSPLSSSWADTWRETRKLLLLIALVAFVLVLLVSQAFSASPSPPERVRGSFGQCGVDTAAECVVDGDTFRLGERRVRVVGIDTAERRARCEGEREQAERSTLALRTWLNRGPFTMTPNPARAVDRYGRELQVVERVDEGGRIDALAEWMQAEGGARPYAGGTRGGWC